MIEEKLNELIEKAKGGMANAFCPVNKFPVGASLLTDSGKIFVGCNVESVIAGLGTCAERCVIGNAVAEGEYCFDKIVIVSKLEEPVKPCGMCLQFIGEFAQVAEHDIEIIMVGSKGKIEKSSANKMLPDTYGPRVAGKDLSKYECKNLKVERS
jgi:cytidine deaminase